MQICKGEKVYKCSRIECKYADGIRTIRFSILEAVPPEEIKKIFTDSTFYFYNEEWNVSSIETNYTDLVGAFIKYNVDSTCDITIKLTKRS